MMPISRDSMVLEQIVMQLDDFFQIQSFPPDQPFSTVLPTTYCDFGLDPVKYFTPNFLSSFHGLMAHYSTQVKAIYLVVFFSQEVLEKIFSRGERDLLVISHHPLAMETSGRGFLPVPAEYLEQMRARRISAYVLHTPLDTHSEISTTRAVARKLNLHALTHYLSGDMGYACLRGVLCREVPFKSFLASVSAATGVNELHFTEKRGTVRTVALVPGGAEVDDLIRTTRAGCDALVTGTYYNQVNNSFAQRQRDEFRKIQDRLDFNLIECSHYGFEAVVMRHDLLNFCAAQFKLNCEFVTQADPWY